MVRKERIVSERENMRGGKGAVTLKNWLEPEQLPANVRLMTHIHIPVGASIGDHVHEGEAEVFYVLAGRALYNDDGEKVEVGPGNIMVCYDGQTHGVENIGSEEFVMIAAIVSG